MLIFVPFNVIIFYISDEFEIVEKNLKGEAFSFWLGVILRDLSPEGRCVVYPIGVQLRLFPFIEFWVRKGILDFKNLWSLSTFFASKCFIPRTRREIRSISLGVQLILFPFIVLVNE